MSDNSVQTVTNYQLIEVSKQIELLTTRLAAVEVENEMEKAKVLDLQQKMDRILQCPACPNTYNTFNVPIIQSCGHTICMMCMTCSFERSEPVEKEDFPECRATECPLCKEHGYYKSMDEIKLRRKNFQLMNLL